MKKMLAMLQPIIALLYLLWYYAWAVFGVYRQMAPSSSGPGLRVLSPAIAGSNPAGVTNIIQ